MKEGIQNLSRNNNWCVQNSSGKAAGVVGSPCEQCSGAPLQLVNHAWLFFSFVSSYKLNIYFALNKILADPFCDHILNQIAAVQLCTCFSEGYTKLMVTQKQCNKHFMPPLMQEIRLIINRNFIDSLFIVNLLRGSFSSNAVSFHLFFAEVHFFLENCHKALAQPKKKLCSLY